MFNYFCVSYRGMEAGHIYIADISFKKCVQTRTGHHIFISSADCHCFSCRRKFDVIFKFNETKRSNHVCKTPPFEFSPFSALISQFRELRKQAGAVLQHFNKNRALHFYISGPRAITRDLRI